MSELGENQKQEENVTNTKIVGYSLVEATLETGRQRISERERQMYVAEKMKYR